MLICAALLGLANSSAFAQTASPTLDGVKARGFVRCGVTAGVPGFYAVGADGTPAGLEVDYCRSLAAAIFADPAAVRYTALPVPELFTALAARDIDVLAAATTWTASHDMQPDTIFVGTMFYDAQGFMVRRSAGFTSAIQLSGEPVCVQSGTTAVENAIDYFAANSISFEPREFLTQDEMAKAYQDGLCTVYSAGTMVLAAMRSTFAVPEDHVILPEIASKEPLGAAVRVGDPVWFKIARWTHFAMLEAEELGVTQINVDEMLGSDNTAIKRLLGVEGAYGEAMGLTEDWAYRIVRYVGNFSESYERNFGAASSIGLPRGLNALWRDGGIQHSPPAR